MACQATELRNPSQRVKLNSYHDPGVLNDIGKWLREHKHTVHCCSGSLLLMLLSSVMEY